VRKPASAGFLVFAGRFKPTFFVVSGLAPRWVAQQPQKQPLKFAWRTAFVLTGAASQPNAGQARSPQKARARH